MEVTLLLAIHDQFGIALADALDLVPGVLLQAPGHIGPLDLIHPGARRLRRQGFSRRVERLGRRLAAGEVGVEGDTEHRCIAALPGCAEVDRVSYFEHRAEVDRRVLLDLVVLRLVLVIVALVFEFQAETIPGCLVAHSAEKGRAAAKIGPGVDITGTFAVGPGLEAVTDVAQRVFEVAAVAQVAPGNAGAEIEIVVALVGHHELTGEQACTTDVPEAQGHLGRPMGFFPQAGLEVDRLVLVALVAAQRLGAIGAVGDRGVAKRAFQPLKWLE
ncbi:hypothetical protein D3C71_1501140 [compost metagenome]